MPEQDGSRSLRDTVVIGAGPLRAEIVPSLGGGLARFDLVDGDTLLPVLRPWPDAGTDDPNELACYVLLPWSNRISGGGFRFGGRFHHLDPTVESEPFPLHGNGWRRPWQVAEMDATRILLRLASTGPGPFHYEAALGYRIDERALITTLAVTNTGQESLPFGLGFHPWFPRTAATVLQAPARAVWAETDRHLRSGSAPVGIPEEWDFAKPRPLPEAWINNSFVGWDGHARIAWPDRGIALDVTARGLETYVLFSPNGAAEYFCFEPVSHVVDAHNLPGEAANNGLIVLAPGEGTEVRCRLTPHFDRA